MPGGAPMIRALLAGLLMDERGERDDDRAMR